METLGRTQSERRRRLALAGSFRLSDRRARTKFEEDIKVPFVSLYSFWTTVRVDPAKPFGTLGNAARIFPDIRQRIAGFRKDAALTLLNGFTALERVIVGASLRIGKSPAVRAECALIVWHDHDRRQNAPVAAELSYRYGDTKERYGGKAARRVRHVSDNPGRTWQVGRSTPGDEDRARL